MSDTDVTVERPKSALPDPVEADNVVYDPSLDRLRELSRHLETTTEYGSPSYVTDQRSRNADRTKNAVDHEFGPRDYEYLEDAVDAAHELEMVCLDRRLGRHPDNSYVCRYYVPTEYGRIALAWAKLFEPAPDSSDPDFHTVQLPDRPEIAVRILPESGFTAVLGSDYTGEVKKSFLRLFMYRTKQRGGLGLHAGSKRVCLRDGDDVIERCQLFLGLSGTGKSTLTAHGLGLESPESATMLQDDVCALLPDGTVAGSEGQGLFVKTIGLDPDEQPAIYEAAIDESAVLENVDVAGDGTVDFDSARYTTNGRAVVQRSELPSAGEDIDLSHVDQVFFITRNPAMPPVAKLDPIEAGAAFMLGESVQTSAGDPSKAGESIRVVGTNPFIVGSEGEEGNRFRDLIAELDVECYVLNTGSVGDRSIRVEDTVHLLRELARSTVEWTSDEATGLTVPSEVPGLDVEAFAIEAILPEYERRIDELREERGAYLDGFEDLDREIKDAVY